MGTEIAISVPIVKAISVPWANILVPNLFTKIGAPSRLKP